MRKNIRRFNTGDRIRVMPLETLKELCTGCGSACVVVNMFQYAGLSGTIRSVCFDRSIEDDAEYARYYISLDDGFRTGEFWDDRALEPEFAESVFTPVDDATINAFFKTRRAKSCAK